MSFQYLRWAARITTEAEAYKLVEELIWTDGTPDACPPLRSR